MLKIAKPALFISGAALGAVAVWYFFSETKTKVVKNEPVKKTPPEVELQPDTTLQKLNSILKRNQGESHTLHAANEVQIESYRNIDNNSRLYDSLRAAYATEETDSDENQDLPANVVITHNEVLKKDRLLGRETLKIISVGKNTLTSDSVSSKMNGITPKSLTSIETEHWASPVNYKGYKLGRTRLVLFGTQPGEVKLLRYENELYMIFLQKVYWLQATGGFGSLKSLQDKKLSASLLSNAN